MARYLFQAAYSNASWRTQLERPQDPIDRVQPLAQKLGGRIHDVYYSFGEYDVVAICEFPDDEAMAAFALAVAAGGATQGGRTTKLLETSAGLSAMRKAQGAASSYTAPIGQLTHT
jgi:uncharacterized protein with GYD domain